MPETIFLRGEGGAVFAHDLPLPDGVAQRFASGVIQQVNEDGTPYEEAPTKAPSGRAKRASA